MACVGARRDSAVGPTAHSYRRLFTHKPLRNLGLWRGLKPWFRRPWSVVASRAYRGPVRLVEAEMRGGAALTYRDATSDIHVICQLLAYDEYRMRALPKGKIPWIVDVGAHIGLFAIQAAPRAEHVLAYEPVPENFALLAKNLAGPAFSHVESRNVAVMGRPGTLRLFLGGWKTDAHTLVAPSEGATAAALNVPCVSLAEELTARGVPRVGLLKIDCEGSEYSILEGLEAWGLGRIDRVAMEYHPAPQGAPPSHSREGLEKRFRAAGFRVTCVPGHAESLGLLFATRDEPT